MNLTISEEVEKIFNSITRFIEENSANPVFWVVLVVIIVAITFSVISNLGDK